MGGRNRRVVENSRPAWTAQWDPDPEREQEAWWFSPQCSEEPQCFTRECTRSGSISERWLLCLWEGCIRTQAGLATCWAGQHLSQMVTVSRPLVGTLMRLAQNRDEREQFKKSESFLWLWDYPGLHSKFQDTERSCLLNKQTAKVPFYTRFTKSIHLFSQQDGSASAGACCQAWCPQLTLRIELLVLSSTEITGISHKIWFILYPFF